MSDHQPPAPSGAPPGQRNTVHGRVPGTVVQAGAIYGDVFVGTRPLPVPAQLPPISEIFTNRAREFAALTALSKPASDTAPARSPRVLVLEGDPGAGKTALAISWAHHAIDRFPDGQLFADLRGYSADLAGPLPADTVLDRFLRALGFGPELIPAHLAEKTALFRSATGGRRVLIVADNACTAEQIQPLVPGSGPALVLVTTRRCPRALVMAGATQLRVSALDQHSSRLLLSRLIGAAPMTAEPQATRALLERAAGSPLRLCTFGADLRIRPGHTIAAILAALAESTRQEDDMTTAALDGVYENLPEEAQQTYQLLGLLQLTDITAPALASIANWGIPGTRQRLNTLTRASMLTRRSGADGAADRFAFAHDEIARHATATANAAYPPADREQAQHRSHTYFLTMAAAAALAILRNRWWLHEEFSHPPVLDLTHHQALAFLDTEHHNLIAVQLQTEQRGSLSIATAIAEADWPRFVHLKDHTGHRRICANGLRCARRSGDEPAQARMLIGLGNVELNQRDFAQAAADFYEALELAESAGHQLAIASALEGLGTWRRLSNKNYDAALAFYMRALNIHRVLAEHDTNRRRGIALMLRHIGETLLAAGRVDEAIERLHEALAIDLGPREGYLTARLMCRLGQACLKKRLLADAQDWLQRSLTILEDLRSVEAQADVRVALADLAHEQDDTATERAELHAAAQIYTDLGTPAAADIAHRLQALDARTTGL